MPYALERDVPLFFCQKLVLTLSFACYAKATLCQEYASNLSERILTYTIPTVVRALTNCSYECQTLES